MAQSETDRLVDRIRLQRQRVSRAWRNCGLLDGVQQSIERHPTGWLLGGAVVGFVALPLLVPVALAAPRRLARLWMRSTLQGGILHLTQGALLDLWSSRVQDPAATPAAHDVWEAATPGEEPPLQASGGPVRPMRVS